MSPFLDFASMIKAAPALAQYQAWRSVYSIVSSFVASEKLRQALSFHTLLVGGNPMTTSAIYALIHKLEKRRRRVVRQGRHQPAGRGRWSRSSSGSAARCGWAIRWSQIDPLPGRQVPRRGLGRGDPAPGRRRAGGRPLGDGVQRRGVRRLAGRGARRADRGGGRDPAGAAVAAHAGRAPAVRPVQRGRPRPPAMPATGRARLRIDPALERAVHDAEAIADRFDAGGDRAAADRAARAAAPIPAPGSDPRWRPAAAGRRHRAARRCRAAAGHHVHLLPRRLRRRGGQCVRPGCG